MLLMVEKGIRGEICQAIHQYAKANNKYEKDYEKNKEWSYHTFTIIYHFLPVRRNIEKNEKLVDNLHDKIEHVIHIRNLKQELNNRLVLDKFHRVIKFNQKAWLKPYIGMNTKQRKKAKNQRDEKWSFWKNYGKYEKT